MNLTNFGLIKKERLNFVMEQLKNPAAIATVKKELTKRKRKREWIKRRKLNLKQEAEEAIAKRSEMTREIDDKREMIRQKHAGKIRVTIIWLLKFHRFHRFIWLQGSGNPSWSWTGSQWSSQEAEWSQPFDYAAEIVERTSSTSSRIIE